MINSIIERFSEVAEKMKYKMLNFTKKSASQCTLIRQSLKHPPKLLTQTIWQKELAVLIKKQSFQMLELNKNQH